MTQRGRVALRPLRRGSSGRRWDQGPADHFKAGDLVCRIRSPQSGALDDIRRQDSQHTRKIKI